MNIILKGLVVFSLAIILWGVNTPAYSIGDRYILGEERMQKEEIQGIIQKAAKAWETGEVREFVQLFAPNGKFIVPGQESVGQAEIESAVQQFLEKSKNIQISISRIVAEDHVAVVEWHWESTQEGGEADVADDAIVIDFEDGRITRWREYMDRKSFNP